MKFLLLSNVKLTTLNVLFRKTRLPQGSLLNEDQDVGAERRRVTSGSGKYDALVMDNLTKVNLSLVVLNQTCHPGMSNFLQLGHIGTKFDKSGTFKIIFMFILARGVSKAKM